MSPALPPPPGRLIDAGGHRLHLLAAGGGSPTVVFEAGGASWSLDWHLIQTEVAQFTSTCSYDRAGFGWSDPGPRPRTSEQITTELHTALAAAGITKPYVLVGASFGGHTVRLYARHYPDEVVGIILLDARHESLNARMPPAWQQAELAGARMYRFMHAAARIGVLNLLGKLAGEQVAPPVVRKLPPEIQPVYLAVGFQPKYFESNLDELDAVAESDRQLSAAGGLGSLPLTVIRHGIPDLFARMPAEQAQQAEQVWQELQAELVRLSSNGRLLVAEHSGHAIQVDQPDLVVEAIRQMVAAARSSGKEPDGSQ